MVRATANIRPTLSPKRLDLGQIRICFRRRCRRGLDPRVFAASQHPGGESTVPARSLTADTYCRDTFFVHGDVVKIAEPVLQAPEGVKELLASSHRPPARKQTREELRCVAQFLGLDTKLVAAPRIEFGECLPFLANLAPAPG